MSHLKEDYRHSVNHTKTKVAALSRSRPADDPELVAARRELKALTLSEHVRKTVASFPPLTTEQVDRVALLLRGAVK